VSEAILDDWGRYGEHDPENLYRPIVELPKQMEAAWERVGQVDLPDAFRSVRSILVAGMGDSAIGGSLLKSYAEGQISVPCAIWRDFGLPAYANRETLVIVVSQSGNTEETLSALVEARERGCQLLVVTAGGQIAEFANTWQIPLVSLLCQSHPSGAAGDLLATLARILERLGFLPPQRTEFDEVLHVARAAVQQWSGDSPTSENPAKGLALSVRDRAVAVYGVEYLSSVARHWKASLNRSAKVWACWEEFPELTHNAIAGYQLPPGFADKVCVILLSPADLDERVRLRIDVTEHLLDELKVRWRRIEAQGSGKLAQIVSLIALGEFVSYYLALLNGVDPAAMGPIATLNEALERAENTAGVPPIEEPGVRPGLTIPRAPEG
jgi:glucose/mannose-6-phosphate isomerase